MKRSSCRRAAALLFVWALACLPAGCGFLSDEFIVLDRPPPARDAAAVADDARQ